jgi:DUF4097 and DUF4098 domain-containing protein YvlB
MKCVHLILMCGILAGSIFAKAADSARQVKLPISTDGVMKVVNNCGSVTVHPGGQGQILVRSTTHSNKVEAETSSTPDGNRVEIRTHVLAAEKPSSDESSVDYDIAVPSGISIIISTATAPITLDKVSGDVSLSSDTGVITVKNAGNSHLHVRGVSAPIVLANVTGHVEVASSGGSVQLNGVSGPKISVDTTSGNISYQGDFSGGGSYSLITHSGAIDVSLPETASVDMTARSFTGSVENDFPLQTKSHLAFTPSPGRAFAGTSNSGASTVQLQSFSGKIRVKKQ